MIKITKAGWLYILITILLGIAAVNTGNNLLFLIVSALLSFMGISGYFGKRNISKIDIWVEFPEEVFAKKEFYLTVKAINKKAFMPMFLIKVLINDKSVLIPYAEKEGEGKLKISVDQRGIFSIKEAKVCSVFPFNFFERCFTVKVDTKKVVFPEPKECNLFQISDYKFKVKQKSEGQIIEKQGYEGDFLGLRDYNFGTPVKYIDWKASTKSENLKEKVLSAIQSTPTIIEFEKINMDLESKISCITYLAVNHKKFENTFVKVENTTYNLQDKSDRHKLLTKLALYGMKDEAIG